MTSYSMIFNFRSYPHRSKLFCATALIACNSTAIADTQFGVVGSPIDLSAYVKEAIQPGVTVFEDSKPVFGTQPSPKQSAELLHLASSGINASGRSTNIPQAFASSLAESDGNGGVGVSSLLLGNPGNPGDQVVGQLVAQSLWTQTFTYNGSSTVDFSLNLHIPSLQVALIGVAPNRAAISATESASAIAMVTSLITHSDGTFSTGANFEFGLREFESQILLGPNLYENFGDLEFIGSNNVTLFDSLKYNGTVGVHNFTPTWTLDSVSTSVKLGTLNTGDILSYVYTLTTQGTTHGGEHGYYAFLGDPFGVDIVGGNLTTTVTSAVPLPPAFTLMLTGLGAVSWMARRRAAGQSINGAEGSISIMG